MHLIQSLPAVTIYLVFKSILDSNWTRKNQTLGYAGSRPENVSNNTKLARTVDKKHLRKKIYFYSLVSGNDTAKKHALLQTVKRGKVPAPRHLQLMVNSTSVKTAIH